MLFFGLFVCYVMCVLRAFIAFVLCVVFVVSDLRAYLRGLADVFRFAWSVVRGVCWLFQRVSYV